MLMAAPLRDEIQDPEIRMGDIWAIKYRLDPFAPVLVVEHVSGGLFLLRFL